MESDFDPVNHRSGEVVAVWNELTLIWGGIQPNGSSWDPAIIYCHQDGIWTPKTTIGEIPPPRFGAAAEVIGNSLYVMCGRLLGDEEKFTNDIHKLDLNAWTWSKLEPKGTKPLKSLRMTSWVSEEKKAV